ncbi:MAG: DMT family transporter [Oscillospiraceae bacterium]|nr:DMT family transporter [Oscillospiraceae bacterium]
MSKKWIGNLMLLLASMIWGAAFVAQTEAMKYTGPFTFQATRFFLGGLVLLPVIAVMDKRGNPKKPVTKEAKKYQLFAGIICGLILFAACSPQQLGLMLQLPAGKSGFITSLYIILVPIFGLFLGKKLRPWVWLSVALALFGLYMLCGMGGFSLNMGEGLTLICAVAFTFHILFIDHVSPRVDGVRLSCLQFFTCGAISLVIALILEQPGLDSLLRCWLPIAYTGIFSSGVAYTFQIVGQGYTEPTTASLLMSLESVFSAVFGWLLINQALSGWELLGCVLVFAGVLIAQLPERKKLT